MPPKQQQAKAGKATKTFSAPRDILPKHITNNPREPLMPRQQEQTSKSQLSQNIYTPVTLPEEWPGDEAAKNFDFGLNNPEKMFTDPNGEIKYPPSFEAKEDLVLVYKRPKEYFKSYNMKNVMALEKRNFTKSLMSHSRSYKELGEEELSPPRRPKAYKKRLYDYGAIIRQDDPLLNCESNQNTNPQNQIAQKKDPDVQEGDVDYMDNGEVNIEICKFFEREETEEEKERRKIEDEKKAAQGGGKDAKKKDKKKVEEEGPMIIKEPTLTDIIFMDNLPYFSKWVGSILQAIKNCNIRDSYSGATILSKIYPQRDGQPVYNPTGRYWVKQYFQGKERKIEVDDLMPMDAFSFKFLFPTAEKMNHIWPLIITKALYKLFQIKWKTGDFDQEIGDGTVMYSLTGLIPSTIHTAKLDSKHLDNIRDLLSDNKFLNDSAFVMGYNTTKHDAVSQSNMVDPKQAWKLILKNQTLNKKMNLSIAQISESLKENVIKPKIMTGVGYSIADYFQNDNFNMIYVKRITDYEIKLRTECLSSLKITTHKLSRDQILEIKKNRRDLKTKIKEEEKKRIDLMQKNPVQYKFFRVFSGMYNSPEMSIVSPFSNEEIFLAKKCIMNKIQKPPNYYDFYDVRVEEKSVASGDRAHSNNQINALEQSIQSALKPLDDFSRIPNHNEPVNREVEGQWLKDSDFYGCFEFIQIYYNPTKFAHNEQKVTQWEAELENNASDNLEVLVLDQLMETVNEGTEDEPEEVSSLSRDSIELVIGFNPGESSEVLNLKPYCILQSFDFMNQTSAKNFQPLKGPFNSLYLKNQNQNQVFRLATYSPMPYTLNVVSNTSYKFMSIVDYLVNNENWKQKTQVVEYNPIEKNKKIILAKILQDADMTTDLLVKLEPQGDHQIFKFMSYKLIDIEKDATTLNPIENDEGIFSFDTVTSWSSKDLFKVRLNPNKKKLFIIECCPNYNTGEGSFKIEFLSKSDFDLKQFELTETMEYIDKYHPNKYGLVFRERLFVNNSEVFSTFKCHLSDFIDPSGELNDETMIGKPGKDVKAAKGGKAVQPTSTGPDRDNEKQPSLLKRIYLELFLEDQLIMTTSGKNACGFENIVLSGSKEQHANYYLQARLELRDCEDATSINEYTKDLHWVLSVSSNDTIAIVKDTQKEDAEKAQIKSWEDKESGRSDHAKNSREVFLLKQRRRNGEELNEEESEKISHPRVYKKKTEEEVQVQAGKPNPKAKKAPPPKGKPAVEEEVKKEVKKEVKVFPKSTEHIMQQVVFFLRHLEADRTLYEKLPEHRKPHVRTDEENEKVREICGVSIEDGLSVMSKNNYNRDRIAKIRNTLQEELSGKYEESRKSRREQWDDIFKDRETLKENLNGLIEVEKALMEAMFSEEANQETLEAAIEKAKESNLDGKLMKIANKVCCNLVIKGLEAKLIDALENYELEIVKEVYDKVEEEGIQVDEELKAKAEDLIIQAESNPNFIAEKQAELKKTTKGKPGKK